MKRLRKKKKSQKRKKKRNRKLNQKKKNQKKKNQQKKNQQKKNLKKKQRRRKLKNKRNKQEENNSLPIHTNLGSIGMHSWFKIVFFINVQGWKMEKFSWTIALRPTFISVSYHYFDLIVS